MVCLPKMCWIGWQRSQQLAWPACKSCALRVCQLLLVRGRALLPLWMTTGCRLAMLHLDRTDRQCGIRPCKSTLCYSMSDLIQGCSCPIHNRSQMLQVMPVK